LRSTAFVQAIALDLGQAFCRDLLLELGDLGDVLLEIGAGEKRVAHAGDNCDPRSVVVAETIPGLTQQFEMLHIRAVPRFRPIDRDQHDMIGIALIVDRHGADSSDAASPSASRQVHRAPSVTGQAMRRSRIAIFKSSGTTIRRCATMVARRSR
jgi:hypothetical protein